jgi:signal transduction histidine kinase
MVRELAAERKHDVSLVFTSASGDGDRDADPPMLADSRRLVQVLVNLLGNAITYTPAGGGGRIRLVVHVGASDVTFAIEDNGVGISAEDQARLFREFERLGDPSVGHGFGIGLALSKRLVEEHGGTIRAESQAGSGSRFIVSLPRRIDQMDKWKQDHAAAIRRAAASAAPGVPDAPR